MPTERQLQRMVADARRQWTEDGALALVEIGEFLVAIGQTLGGISRDEAVTALQRKAREVFERLR